MFDVLLVIMLTDDEKFLFRPLLTIPDVKFSCQNAADIFAVAWRLKYQKPTLFHLNSSPRSGVPNQRRRHRLVVLQSL